MTILGTYNKYIHVPEKERERGNSNKGDTNPFPVSNFPTVLGYNTADSNGSCLPAISCFSSGRQHWPNKLSFLILYQRIPGKHPKGNENHKLSASLLNSSAGFLAGQSYFHAANAFFQRDPCPGLSPLQDIKHDNHTCPSATTEAGERLKSITSSQSCAQGSSEGRGLLWAALKIEDYHGLPWRLRTFTKGRKQLLILLTEISWHGLQLRRDCSLWPHGLPLAAPFTGCGGGTQHQNALQSKRKFTAQLSNSITLLKESIFTFMPELWKVPRWRCYYFHWWKTKIKLPASPRHTFLVFSLAVYPAFPSPVCEAEPRWAMLPHCWCEVNSGSEELAVLGPLKSLPFSKSRALHPASKSPH